MNCVKALKKDYTRSCLTCLLFWSYSRFGWSAKVNFWELLWQHFLWLSFCHPVNSVKALK